MNWYLIFKWRKKKKRELAEALLTLHEFFKVIDENLLLTGLEKKKFWLEFIEKGQFRQDVLDYLIEEKSVNKLVKKVLKIKL